jgi:hypothetical protein
VKKTTLVFLVFLFSFSLNSFAQLTIDAELRPRFEYRHGYKTLFPNNVDAASFVSQRTRLNAGYTFEKLNFYLSFQDVRVWGDVPQLNTVDENGLSVHQAWGELLFNQHFGARVGRQEIVYDDHRIMGNVGWAQQARSHDAALLKFQKNKFSTDVGYAFNQSGEMLTGHVLNVNTYKSLFYVWMHHDWDSFGASFLFLNNGLQFTDAENESNNETRYSNTTGSHLSYKKGNLNLNANLYYQFGNDVSNNNISAYLLGLEANFKASQMTSLGLGGELQSGNDNGVPLNGENNAFTPLYGTNHKFNGFMDYFYVGNHMNHIGLVDLYVKTKLTVNEKSGFDIAVHYFSAAADIPGTDSRELGTEIDLGYSYQFSKEININAGYSHMFPSEGLEIIKDNFDNNTNNWGWVMITISPTLFTSEKNNSNL